MKAATVKTGDFVELRSTQRDILQRVGIVGKVSEYNGKWYFEAATLTVLPNNGEFRGVYVGTYQESEEGTEWRRLQVADGATATTDAAEVTGVEI